MCVYASADIHKIKMNNNKKNQSIHELTMIKSYVTHVSLVAEVTGFTRLPEDCVEWVEEGMLALQKAL